MVSSPFSLISTTASANGRPLAHILRKLEGSVYKESPLVALKTGRWTKLICGASFEDVAEVRNLSLVYALAGVDCIDCAADEAVVSAVLEGVQVAKDIALNLGYELRNPWLMVSINDDQDPHFRKAEFNPDFCPPDCPRPCERVCPASAICFSSSGGGGVLAERCYGCGRCLPVCPVQNIEARTFVRSLEAVSQLLEHKVDAVEIHTGKGHLEAFHDLISKLASSLKRLKLLAVSVPDLGDSMLPAMTSMYKSIRHHDILCPNLWQLDGRPMSGDIGRGTTRAAVALATRMAAEANRPPGFLQLAGGTNYYTKTALELAGLGVQSETGIIISGIGFGSHARKVVRHQLKEIQTLGISRLEDHTNLLEQCVCEAGQVVWPIKL